MSKVQARSFEESLRQLERVVGDLEGGELGLDEALARYEQGVSMLARCRGLLDVAERKVALLTGVDKKGEPVIEPFDASATFEAEAQPPAPTDKPTEPSPALIEPPFDPT
ncbi:hypothetical protein BH23PLA1_BH23PLA1_05810 [soil metagenome]